ncbi:hypothetical protein OR221_1894 [Microbacterium laevaniformans OR221]|nr:hypothetical protein OR221_1894 [Microbacterium laevaniformans OR221]
MPPVVVVQQRNKIFSSVFNAGLAKGVRVGLTRDLDNFDLVRVLKIYRRGGGQNIDVYVYVLLRKC